MTRYKPAKPRFPARCLLVMLRIPRCIEGQQHTPSLTTEIPLEAHRVR